MAAPMDGAPVVARRQTIYIGTVARMRQDAAHVWQYDLTLVGIAHMHLCRNSPSTTYRNDIMLIVKEANLDGQKLFIVFVKDENVMDSWKSVRRFSALQVPLGLLGGR